tara:strand:- start:3262 stop:3438 length:177 start_codon:yes stop_codon:yes gene_type:complete
LFSVIFFFMKTIKKFRKPEPSKLEKAIARINSFLPAPPKKRKPLGLDRFGNSPFRTRF